MTWKWNYLSLSLSSRKLDLWLYSVILGVMVVEVVYIQTGGGQMLGPTQAEIEAAEAFDRKLRPYLDEVRSKNQLNYGDLCDFTLEHKRQGLGRSFLQMLSAANEPSSLETGLTPITPTQLNANVLQNFKSLAALPGHFCSAFGNLLCNSSGHCDCAKADFDHEPKIYFIREGDGCVLGPGSFCPVQSLPITGLLEENLELRQGSPNANPLEKEEPKCSSTALCKVKNSKEFCTFSNVQLEITKIAKSLKDESHEDRINFGKMLEGICTCDGVSLTHPHLPFLISTITILLFQF